jgi:hypothetical protein
MEFTAMGSNPDNDPIRHHVTWEEWQELVGWVERHMDTDGWERDAMQWTPDD